MFAQPQPICFEILASAIIAALGARVFQRKPFRRNSGTDTDGVSTFHGGVINLKLREKRLVADVADFKWIIFAKLLA